MSAKDDGGPAFPVEWSQSLEASHVINPGMSLRDWFAGHSILTAAIQLGDVGKPTLDIPSDAIAKKAHEIADAMLAERRKDEG